VASGAAMDVAMTKRFPLPWWHVLDGPELRTAPGGVYRAVIALSVAYWAGGCVDMPNDDVTQAALARLPVGGWRSVKPAVSLALSAICPRLEADYAAAHAAWQRQVANATVMRMGKGLLKSKAPNPDPRLTVPAPRLTIPATALTSTGTAANSRRSRELARSAKQAAPGASGTSGKATFTD